MIALAIFGLLGLLAFSGRGSVRRGRRMRLREESPGERLVRYPSYALTTYESVPVSDLQILLQVLGLYDGPIDGNWSNRVMRGLVSFAGLRFPVSVIPYRPQPESSPIEWGLLRTRSGLITRMVDVSPYDLIVALDLAASKRNPGERQRLLDEHAIEGLDPSDGWQRYRSTPQGLRAWQQRIGFPSREPRPA